jgi:PhoH-like ATPase
MRKIFILDTSVLVHAAHSIFSFENSLVILPIVILEELDKVKKLSNETGKNARLAIRLLDDLSSQGEIHNGIEIEDGITIKIDTSEYGSIGNDLTYGDNKILACVAKIQESNPKSKVIFVSRDINLRTRARALGVAAESYEQDRTAPDDLFTGFRIVENKKAGIALANTGAISISDHKGLEDLYPNECVLFEDKKGICGRRTGDEIKLIREIAPWNLKLRNKEQLFASELMMDENIPLVSIIGNAGSGKTLISLACGLEMVLNKKIYDRLIIYRPISVIGNDIGYLPGSEQEKLAPYFVPISDAMSFLLSDKTRKKDGWKQQLFQYIDSGVIQQEALTYIRGRSISNSLMMVDEAQNIDAESMKAILTRAGVGTKIILNGDVSQVDQKGLDPTNNGLNYVIEKFRDSELAGHITLMKGERSDLATEAARIL